MRVQRAALHGEPRIGGFKSGSLRWAALLISLVLLAVTAPASYAMSPAVAPMGLAPSARAAVLTAAASAANVGKPQCQPGDRPETGLQGRVPPADRTSGRAVQGYTCNLKLVGAFASASFANFDSYKNCVYYSDNRGGSGSFIGQGGPADGGGVVLDVSNPAHPVKTAYLTAWAMKNAGESLRVNIARGLLVADYYNLNSAEPVRSLAVYDVSKDCRYPQLLADIQAMPNAVGHEGCFQPNGMAYYMASSTLTITPIDLSDPAHPREMSAPWPLPVHGCSISADGNRGYFEVTALASTPPGTGTMVIADTSAVQARSSNPQLQIIGTSNAPFGVQQSSYPLTYSGHPYVFDWSEALPQGRTCAADAPSTFGYARFIDIADELHPQQVSSLINEVQDPANCAEVTGDDSSQTQGLAEGDPFWATAGASLFLYDTHYCRPDRLQDPTIMACAQFGSGLRVYDIRNPYQPREIAYYNTGVASAANGSLDFAVAPPVIRRDLGQIWWVTLYQGFHVAQFEAGTWPFTSSDPCTKPYDYFAAQYDLKYAACPAVTAAAVAAPPVAGTAPHGRRPAGPWSSARLLSQAGTRPAATTLEALSVLLLAGCLRLAIRRRTQIRLRTRVRQPAV
jgi:hypothetical protein